ncbi:unnamed protein product, partial [Choristocarpus tenellus]
NTKDVKDLVKNFDFNKMSSVDKKKKEGLVFALAPSFGQLNSQSVKTMDDELKVIIAGTTRLIAKLKDKSWQNVIGALTQNSLLEPMNESEISRSDKLIKDGGTSAFKFDGSPDSTIVKEVQSWFVDFIKDDDVLSATGIDIEVLAKIVASSGASVDSFEAFFGKHEYHEQTVIEIGVLRYPDIENPYFKVYRIQLTAWSDSRRVLMVENNKNGITGEYNCRKYKPRASTIAGLKEETRAQAIQEAEDLFA